MTENDSGRLRDDLRGLQDRLARGEVVRHRFVRKQTELCVDLCRAVAAESLAHGERVTAEHHFAFGHMRLTESVMREPEEEAVSLFLTDRRLLRIRMRIVPGQPPSCDAVDGTAVDFVVLPLITALRKRRQFRTGEAVAGLVILAVAFLFRSFLAITWLFMAALGAGGVLHAFLLPTSWTEVEVQGAPPDPPMRIFAARRRTGRALLRKLRETLRSNGRLG